MDDNTISHTSVAEVVDLCALSTNFPQTLPSEVGRDAFVNTLTTHLKSDVYVAIIEGPEGIRFRPFRYSSG